MSSRKDNIICVSRESVFRPIAQTIVELCNHKINKITAFRQICGDISGISETEKEIASEYLKGTLVSDLYGLGGEIGDALKELRK